MTTRRLLVCVLLIVLVFSPSSNTKSNQRADNTEAYSAFDVLRNLDKSERNLKNTISEITATTGMLLGSRRAPEGERRLRLALKALPNVGELTENKYVTVQFITWYLKTLLSMTLDNQGKTQEGVEILENVLNYNNDENLKRIIFADKNIAQVINFSRITLISFLETLGHSNRVENELNIGLNFTKLIFGPNSTEHLNALEQKSNWLDSQNRYKEAEKIWNHLYKTKILIFGDASSEAGKALHWISNNLSIQGRHLEATKNLRHALVILERHFMPYDKTLQSILISLANSLLEIGSFNEAMQVFERIKTESRGHSKGVIGNYEISEAFKNGMQKLGETFGSSYNLEMFKEVFFKDEVGEAKLKSTVADALLVNNYPKLALELNRESMIFYKNRMVNSSHIVKLKRRLVPDGHDIFIEHLKMLRLVLNTEETESFKYYAESFEVAQLAQSISTADGLMKMAIRFASGQNKLAVKIRAMQDAQNAWRSYDNQLLKTLNKLKNEESGEKEKRLRHQLEILEERIKFLSKAVFTAFPQFAALTSSQPTSLADIQALLGPDEAMISYVSGYDITSVFALRHDQVEAKVIKLGAEELEGAVGTLRRGLDLKNLSRPPSYDTKKAFALYQKIFEPIEPLLEGARHVFVVPDGALTGLPLGVLVTEPTDVDDKDPASYRKVPWLARKYAMSTLPSVSSLKALRAFTKRAQASRPFLGIGDPELEGETGTARGIKLVSLFTSPGIANVKAVRQLAPLPESREELQSLARSLGAGDGSLLVGSDATETNVKSAPLSDFKVIAFATHGLVAGEHSGEPALVLTPPLKGTDTDDGLLTASEVAQLKLNADWVILSACNTAAADGTPGARGLSGLAKAFFYAGSRALLVSHWTVQSDAAVALTTRMLALSGKGITRAEAHRQAMMAMIDKGPVKNAHPALWAPFVVVGEGGK
jgi:CHAT domain-containing protein